MNYTLIRIDLNGENDRHPLQKQEIVTDPLRREVNKDVSMGKFSNTVNWDRRNSIQPYNFDLSCYYVEMMTLFTAVHDMMCFGIEVLRASPRQADLMVVTGTCFTKVAPVIQCLYDQVLELKWVISMDACANPDGMCDIYPVMQGVNKFIPVNVYILGYPPRSEACMQALMLLQEPIDREHRPLSWVVDDQGVYHASIQSERERKRGERTTVTNLHMPDEI